MIAITILLALISAGGLIAGIVYLIRLGVQFALADLVMAFLILGFSPALAGSILRKVPDPSLNNLSLNVWTSALSLTFVVFVYQVYGFYWASIKPASTARRRFNQRFVGSIGLTVLGALALSYMA